MKDFLSFAALVLPGFFPAMVICGIRPAAIFAVPLISGLEAAVSALVTFVVPGSFTAWFVAVVVVVNLIAVAVLGYSNRRAIRIGPWRAESIGVAVVAAGVIWPLLVLKAPIIGYDAQAIWLLHASMVSGGHSVLLADFTNPHYGFSNPDYPPLEPASVAVVYTVRGSASLHVGVVVVALLNASAVGLAAMGLLRIIPASTTISRRVVSHLLVFVFAGAVFGVAGVVGVSGYADLLWSAAAVAATVFGLVLPASGSNLAISGLCITLAGMTKNEGLVTALLLAVLVAGRYFWPLRSWAGAVKAALVAVAPLIIPVAWALALRSKGISNAFLSSKTAGSVSSRFSATVPGMWAQLHVIPIALAVAVFGSCLLVGERRRLGLGHAALLWLVATWSVVAIGATYVFGDLEIHYWLRSSVSRSTIFTNCILIGDLTIWGLVLLNGTGIAPSGRHFRGTVDEPAMTTPPPRSAPRRLSGPVRVRD